jgi:hypothetical protein
LGGEKKLLGFPDAEARLEKSGSFKLNGTISSEGRLSELEVLLIDVSVSVGVISVFE